MNFIKTQDQQSADNLTSSGICCLSGVRAPEDVTHLVVLPGLDAKEYSVSKQMLDKYSRQLYVYGIAAMSKMMNSSVLVSGMSGTGVEIAKNVILAGVKSFTVHDIKMTTSMDLASNFFLSEKDVGQNRAQACLSKLKELNKLTPVTLSTSPLECTKESIGNHTVIVLVDYTQQRLEEIGTYCHNNGIIFLAVGTYGLYGYAFSDFGVGHKISDTDGLRPLSGLVVGIEQGDEEGTTKILTEEKESHGLTDGDHIVITGLPNDAMEWKKLLQGQSFPIKRVTKKKVTIQKLKNGETEENISKVTNFQAFQIPIDISELGEYKYGSIYYNQHKPVVDVTHLPFNESMQSPANVSNLLYQYNDFGLPQKLHFYLLELWNYQKNNDGHLPKSGCLKDAEKVATSVLVRMNITSEDNNEEYTATYNKIIQLCLGCRGHLNPMATIFGGIVGQEVMKGCSGKYTPLNQMFHFEASNCLPHDIALNENECTPSTSDPTRYDSITSTMGLQFVKKLQNTKVFLVGAGALGCELIKNLAMCGVGTAINNNGSNGTNGTNGTNGSNGSNGSNKEGETKSIGNGVKNGNGVTITDMDVIENSNLCRQFLFREWDVQQEKSFVAAKAATAMNPSFQPNALNIKVAPDTSPTYNDAFWNNQDVIINALDNVIARQYVDTQCTFYSKPLLESGTKGVVANVQPIIPHLTQCYNDVSDPPEKETAICTLKSFPYKVEHTIQWGRDIFGGVFEQNPLQVNQWLLNGETWVEDMKKDSKSGVTRVKTVHELLVPSEVNGKYQIGKCNTIEDCIKFARIQFETLFSSPIINLLHQYPPDKTDENGKLFWRGDKKLCKPAVFNCNIQDHMDFIRASTHLCANLYNVPLTTYNGNALPDNLITDDILRSIVTTIALPIFVPDGSTKIAANDKERKKMEAEKEQENKMTNLDGNELIDSLINEFPKDLIDSNNNNWKMVPEEFEKDDDTNHHMDFITAASNLRCANYDIRDATGKIGADKMKTRKIAGNIIPAVATTTALTTGAVMLEFFKIVSERNTIEDYSSWNFNVGVNQYTSFEPTPCDTFEFSGKKYSIWSYIDVDDQPVGEFMEWFEEEYGLEIERIEWGALTMLNTFLWDDEDVDKIKEMMLSEAVADVRKVDIEEVKTNMYMMLDVTGDDDDDEDDEDSEDGDEDGDENDEKEVPKIRVKLR